MGARDAKTQAGPRDYAVQWLTTTEGVEMAFLDDEVRFYGRREGIIVYEGTGTYRTGPTRYDPQRGDPFILDESMRMFPHGRSSKGFALSAADAFTRAVGDVYDREGIDGVCERLGRALCMDADEVKGYLVDAMNATPDEAYRSYAASLERTVRMLDGSTVTLTGKGGAAAGIDDSYLRVTAQAEAIALRMEREQDGIREAWRRLDSPWEPDPTPRPLGLQGLGFGLASEVWCG